MKDAVSKLRDQNLAMQAEVRKILTDNGYPENYFEPKYFVKSVEIRVTMTLTVRL